MNQYIGQDKMETELYDLLRRLLPIWYQTDNPFRELAVMELMDKINRVHADLSRKIKSEDIP